MSFAASRFDIVIPQAFLDPIDDGGHLPFTVGADQQEDVGDGQLIGDVEGNEILATFVRPRDSGGLGQLDGVVGGGQNAVLP